MSRTLANFLAGATRGATSWMRPQRRRITRALVGEALVQVLPVETPAGPLLFWSPTARSLHDPLKFLEGEPETLRWIEALPPGEVLWDIGANIGMYALYAARRGLKVLAFEPSASSYAALVRNIELNRMDQTIEAYCLAFDETTRLAHLHMAHTEAGHSMHAFGTDQTVQGPLNVDFRQSVPGFSIDEFRRLFQPATPAHIKLDVDSIELAILKGGAETLRRDVKSVLVELDGSNRGEGGAPIKALLAELGFVVDDVFAAQPSTRNTLFRKTG